MRVLFTTTGHSGHLLPLVPLAEACRRAGHDVLLGTHSVRAPNVERLGLDVRAVQEAPDEAWAPLMGQLPGLTQSEGDARIIGVGFALLIGGAVVTESVFALPGIGRLTVDAIVRRDYPVIQGVILIISGVYVLLNLCIDVLYVVLDPRIRY